MSTDVLWRPNTDSTRPPPLLPGDVYRPDIIEVIDQTIDSLRPQLRELSDKIHGKAVRRHVAATDRISPVPFYTQLIPS